MSFRMTCDEDSALSTSSSYWTSGSVRFWLRVAGLTSWIGYYRYRGHDVHSIQSSIRFTEWLDMFHLLNGPRTWRLSVHVMHVSYLLPAELNTSLKHYIP